MKSANKPSKEAVKGHLERMVKQDPGRNGLYNDLIEREKSFEKKNEGGGGGGAFVFVLILIILGGVGWLVL